MKVALVHDWLTGMRGGERVLEILCELYPEADLYTLLHVKDRLSEVIEGMKIKTSFVQRLPDGLEVLSILPSSLSDGHRTIRSPRL